jgi:hypothetical protein
MVAADVPQPPTNTPDTLRAAINDLMQTFGQRYPNGPAYLKRLDVIEKKQAMPTFPGSPTSVIGVSKSTPPAPPIRVTNRRA